MNDSPDRDAEKKRANRSAVKQGAIAALIGAISGAISAWFVTLGRAFASGVVIDVIIVVAFTTAFTRFMVVSEHLLAFASLALLVLWYLAREQIRRR